jgi:D-arabinonate dehydratase
VEYFYRDQDVKVFDDVLAYPMVPEEGALTPPDRPGHGVVLDDDRVAEFRVER